MIITSFKTINAGSYGDTRIVSDILNQKFKACYENIVDTYNYSSIIRHIETLEQKVDKTLDDITAVYDIFITQIEKVFLDFIGYVTLLNNSQPDDYMNNYKPDYWFLYKFYKK